MTREIAVIAAHPDDEVLGCGATIARHAAAGEHVRILILAEGATSRSESSGLPLVGDEVHALRVAGMAAAKILGAKSIDWAGFPDNRMDGVSLLDIVKRVEAFLQQRPPDVVYTHHSGDMNVDHFITHRAVMTAMRPLPESKFCTVLQFEIASSSEWGNPVADTPFTPQWFEDVSDFLPVKISALEAYDSEMRPPPHPRSFEGVSALARWRGFTAGVAAAEAFVLAWHINRNKP